MKKLTIEWRHGYEEIPAELIRKAVYKIIGSNQS